MYNNLLKYRSSVIIGPFHIRITSWAIIRGYPIARDIVRHYQTPVMFLSHLTPNSESSTTLLIFICCIRNYLLVISGILRNTGDILGITFQVELWGYL